MADAAILEVKADIVITDDIPLDVDLAELGVGGSLGPGHGGVHIAHAGGCDQNRAQVRDQLMASSKGR